VKKITPNSDVAQHLAAIDESRTPVKNEASTEICTDRKLVKEDKA